MPFNTDGVDETQAYVWPTIQMEAIEQYFRVLLFIMLYKMVLTFWSVKDKLVRPLKLKVLKL